MNCKYCIFCGEIRNNKMSCDKVEVEFDVTDDAFSYGECDFYEERTEPEPPTIQQILADSAPPDVVISEMENTTDEIETTSTGGKQVKEKYDYSLLPKKALHKIVENMTAGAGRYGVGNYLHISINTNAARSIAHLQLATMTEDEQKEFSNEDIERHLINGATRALFALDCYYRGKV